MNDALQAAFKDAFPSGLASMEAGDWLDAEKHFSAALHSAAKTDQVKEAASYLTAVKLVKAQVGFPVPQFSPSPGENSRQSWPGAWISAERFW